MNKLKQNSKKIIEVLRLGKTADLIRFKLEQIKNKNKNNKFLSEHPEIVLPNPFMIYETFNLDFKKYFNTGKEDAEWIIQETKPYLDFENINILDWGCGPGRVVRHFPSLISSSNDIWGCDYNKEYVNWCSKNLDGIHFFQNLLNPPLVFEKEKIDLIYGLSIFTHLSEENHFNWIDEMFRVLRKNGILFITTHGEITKKNLLESEKKNFNNGELVVRGNIKEGYRMYCAYQPVTFMEKLFENKFEIMKHKAGEEQSWGLQQDLWILKRK